MANKTLTVFTPTYNRADILEKLYDSLVNQTSDDFEWLIVDDGSTDCTKSIVKEWMEEGKIEIRYFYQENGGKQRAMNYGAELCRTYLFDCVDSDDQMTPDAVERIVSFWNSNGDEASIAGIVSLRGKNHRESLTGAYLPEGVRLCHFYELYEKYGFSGDTNLIYRTEVLRRFPYHVFEGEKFIGESEQYLQIDDKYQMLLMNQITVICKYRADGYTKNVFKLLKNNPKGYRRVKALGYQHSSTVKNKFLEMAKYCCADIMCDDKQGFREAPSKAAYLFSFVPGYLAYRIYFKNA